MKRPWPPSRSGFVRERTGLGLAGTWPGSTHPAVVRR